jgi:protease I
MSNVLMIIPPVRFRDEELFVTREELKKNGHVIAIASTRTGVIDGSRGGKVKAEINIEEVNTNDYDAVVFVGGGGTTQIFENQDAFRISREMHKQKKIVSAICLAPVILANSGILKNKNATVAGTKVKILEEKGARYTGPGVTVDGNIVTSNAPKASKLFGQKINELLGKK